MWLILTLLIASITAGVVIGSRYGVYWLFLASPTIALVSLTATLLNGFTFWGGSVTAFACVITMQLAYIACGCALAQNPSRLAADRAK